MATGVPFLVAISNQALAQVEGDGAALNEGRGVNPGDTAASSTSPAICGNAQRRPGREPRRHSAPSSNWQPCRYAQRRPGREPRRHPILILSGADVAIPPLNEGRGVNPGDTCSTVPIWHQRAHAQRRPGREPRRHPRSPRSRCSPSPLNEGRGVNPGDTRRRRGASRSRGALNEGRGVNPGDTGHEAQRFAVEVARSTKAGA